MKASGAEDTPSDEDDTQYTCGNNKIGDKNKKF